MTAKRAHVQRMSRATGRSASKRNCVVGISLIQWKDTSSHHAVPQKARTSKRSRDHSYRLQRCVRTAHVQASRRAVSQGWAVTGGGIAGLGGCLILGGPHP
eukprot:5392337-Heterocapsa_arctica.AAC.1